MKILIFTSQIFMFGGAERLAAELAIGLNSVPGITADLLSMYPLDFAGRTQAGSRLRDAGIPTVMSLSDRRPHISTLVPMILRLRKLLEASQYDVLETSLPGPSTIASWATLGTHTVHLSGIHRVFNRNEHNDLRHRLWRSSLFANKQTRFYAISQYAADTWKQYLGVDAARTSVVHNGIHKEYFEVLPDRRGVFEELAIPPGERLLLFVGRISTSKGIDTLLDAVGPILASESLHLLVVGVPNKAAKGLSSSDQGLTDRLNQQIVENGWIDRVRFLGWRNDVPRLMASSDLLVHPTRSEGFGLVLAEAMATGLPIVATNLDAIPELLAGTNSILVPPASPEALRNAVTQSLARSRSEQELAQQNAKKRAQSFRSERRIEQMVRLFQDVVSNR